jgi:LPPG:FO 2-phospho-L-lactate transferase
MKVAVLTGGVGGAKLVLGLTQIMPPADITAIINTGDDFVHLGLPISPDIDTLLYTLSGKANAEQGWGREGESWAFMAALKSLGGADWFNLGDGDLALHISRLPMSDDRVATVIESDIGKLPFQNYFVEHRCAPVVHSIEFSGAQAARPATGVTDALSRADVILIAPSNPWLSIDPILAVPGIADALRAAAAPVVAVSPLVGGTAVKGPTAKLMAELGLPVTNASIATHYQGLIGGLLIDDGDDAPDLAFARTETLMLTLTDRERVAQAAVNLALSLRQ